MRKKENAPIQRSQIESPTSKVEVSPSGLGKSLLQDQKLSVDPLKEPQPNKEMVGMLLSETRGSGNSSSGLERETVRWATVHEIARSGDQGAVKLGLESLLEKSEKVPQHKSELRPRLFHYTTQERYSKIIKDGKIVQTTACIGRQERPVVWLSFAPDWEPTATPWVVNYETGTLYTPTDIEDLAKYDRPIRVEVDPVDYPLEWSQWVQLSRVGHKEAKGLFQVSVKQGSVPKEWRVCFDPIPISQWIAVEFWADGEWRDVETSATQKG